MRVQRSISVGGRRGRALVMGAAMMVPVLTADAATVWQSWYASGNGSWSNPAMWDAWPDGTGGIGSPSYEHTFPNNSATLTHDAVLGGGTATLDGDYTINHLGLYQYVTINGPGSLNVLTGMDWFGGSIGGTGSLTVSAGTVLDMGQVGDSSYSRSLSRTLNSYGTANYSAGYFYLNQGGVFNNYGTFNASTGDDILRSQGTGTFNNVGTFNKLTDQDFRVMPNLVNTGVMNLGAGVMRTESLANEGSGVINVAAGAALTLEGTTTAAGTSTLTGAGTVTFLIGTHTFAAGSFNPTGAVNFTSGTVYVNNAFTPSSLGPVGATVYLSADQSFEDLTLTGTLRSTGTVSVNKSFTWTKGIMQDAGVTVIAPGAFALLEATTGNSVTLYERTMTNHGTAKHAAGTFSMNQGAVFNNHGAYEAAAEGGITRSSGSSTFNNAGTFTKTGTGTYKVSPRFFNTGTTLVTGGLLWLDYNASNSGTIDVSAGSRLRLEADTVHAAGSVITGAGDVLFAGGTHDMSSATLATTGLFQVSGGANVTIANVIAPSGLVSIGMNNSSSNVTFNVDQSFADAEFWGSLHGTGNVTITHDFVWGGSMDGAGKLVIGPSATARFQDVSKVTNRPVEIRGIMEYGVGTLYVNGGGSLTNYGVINAASAGGFARSSGTGAVNNHGLITKTGTTTFAIANPLFNDTDAIVNVNEGTLNLTFGGTNLGKINLAVGTTLGLGASYNYGAGSMIAGPGNVTFSAGTHVIPAETFDPTGVLTVGNSATVTLQGQVNPSALATVAGTLVLNADHSFPNVALTGTLGGSGNVTVSNGLTWNGTISGTGVTTLAAGAVATLAGSTRLLQRQFDNHGVVNHTAGTFPINGGTFNNFGTYNWANAGNVSRNSGTSIWNNAGTFNKDGTTALTMSVAMNNLAGGVVNVNAGSLELSGNGSANAGTINVAGGASLKLATGLTHGVSSVIQGAGGVWFSSGTHTFAPGAYAATGLLTVDGSSLNVTFNGPVNPSAVAPINGTLNFNADQTLGSLTVLTSGTLGGTGHVTLTNGLVWTGGTLAAGGKVVLGAGSTLDLSAGNSRVLNRTIETLGTINYTGGSLSINGGALVSKGTFNATSSSGISRNSGTAAVTNEGIFNKTGTAAFSLGTSVVFGNAAGASVNVNEGTLEIGGTGTNAGTISVAQGAALKFSNSMIHEAGSVIQGPGTVEFTAGTHVFPAGSFNPVGLVRFVGSSNVTLNNVIHPAAIDPISATAVNFNVDQMFASLTATGSGTIGGAGNLTVTGTLVFNGGTFGGTGLLTMPAGSVLEMSSNASRSISRNVDLHGTTNLTDGSVNLNGTAVAVNNFGTMNIAKSGIGRTAGNHTINNVGTLNWTATDGTITSQVVLNNTGTLNVNGGKMTLSTAPAQHTGSNLTGGTWNVQDGASLVLSSGSNITTNDAVVKLHGPTSTFGKINSLVTNNGTFGVYGGRVFATAGMYTNGATGKTIVGDGSSFTTTGAATSTGEITVGAGATLTVKNGLALQPGGVLAVSGGAVVHQGGDSLWNVVQQWTDGSALNVTGGTLRLHSDAGGSFPSISPTLAATVSTTGTLHVASRQHLKSLAIGEGGKYVQQGAHSTTLVLDLDITGTGRLDLGDSKFILDYTAASELEAVRQWVIGGAMVSSDVQNRKTVAFIEASELGVTNWGGIDVDGTAVLAMGTWYGDANLDGRINGDDFALIDRGMRRGLSGWTNGDFDHSGVVDAADYLLIDRVVALQSGTLSPATLAARHVQFGANYVTRLVSAVPEPTFAGLASAALPLLGRRRRAR